MANQSSLLHKQYKNNDNNNNDDNNNDDNNNNQKLIQLLYQNIIENIIFHLSLLPHSSYFNSFIFNNNNLNNNLNNKNLNINNNLAFSFNGFSEFEKECFDWLKEIDCNLFASEEIDQYNEYLSHSSSLIIATYKLNSDFFLSYLFSLLVCFLLF